MSNLTAIVIAVAVVLLAFQVRGNRKALEEMETENEEARAALYAEIADARAVADGRISAVRDATSSALVEQAVLLRTLYKKINGSEDAGR